MDKVWIAIAVLGSMGLLFGLVLAIASKVFYVKTDPRLEQLTECLPGANCGGCGYSGCGGYAQAVLDGTAPIGKCASGGQEAADAMAKIMGVAAEKVGRKVAFVQCSGYSARDKGVYEGIQDCLAASKVAGRGPLICKFGCLGFGNCVKACQYGAISVAGGIARVDQEKCKGCMACAAACPRGIITAAEYHTDIAIACASHAQGSVVLRGCDQGCIGCFKCEKVCPTNAIKVVNNLAVIDYNKCYSCGLCADVCPKKLITNFHFRNEPGQEDYQPAELPAEV